MGWCSGTIAFDAVCGILLSGEPIDKKQFLAKFIHELEMEGWDCQTDSDYFRHPLVQEAFLEAHPDWAEWLEEESRDELSRRERENQNGQKESN